MSNIPRRTVTLAAGWTIPTIAAAAKAPAFAASQDLVCTPLARCKRPGDPEDKSYVVDPNCSSTNGGVASVEVQNVKTGEWIQAEFVEGVGWVAPGFGDSRRDRPVRITDTSGLVKVYTVSFPPC